MANKACERICSRVIRACRKIQPSLFGDDSPLANAWEDICVQEQQGERSLMWEETYEATLLAMLQGDIEDLDSETRWAIWHGTDAGVNWSVDKTASPEKTSTENLADFVLTKYVLPAADSHSNTRIRSFLDKWIR